LVRNVSIIYLVDTAGMNFYSTGWHLGAHDIGKIFSFIVLIILALIVFELLPELHENIVHIVELRRRKEKGMVVDGRIVKAKKTEDQD
jgi:exosortase/archaeosortase